MFGAKAASDTTARVSLRLANGRLSNYWFSLNDRLWLQLRFRGIVQSCLVTSIVGRPVCLRLQQRDAHLRLYPVSILSPCFSSSLS